MLTFFFDVCQNKFYENLKSLNNGLTGTNIIKLADFESYYYMKFVYGFSENVISADLGGKYEKIRKAPDYYRYVSLK